jgi:hypothetical protein
MMVEQHHTRNALQTKLLLKAEKQHEYKQLRFSLPDPINILAWGPVCLTNILMIAKQTCTQAINIHYDQQNVFRTIQLV